MPAALSKLYIVHSVSTSAIFEPGWRSVEEWTAMVAAAAAAMPQPTFEVVEVPRGMPDVDDDGTMRIRMQDDDTVEIRIDGRILILDLGGGQSDPLAQTLAFHAMKHEIPVVRLVDLEGEYQSRWYFMDPVPGVRWNPDTPYEGVDTALHALASGAGPDFARVKEEFPELVELGVI